MPRLPLSQLIGQHGLQGSPRIRDNCSSYFLPPSLSNSRNLEPALSATPVQSVDIEWVTQCARATSGRSLSPLSLFTWLPHFVQHVTPQRMLSRKKAEGIFRVLWTHFPVLALFIVCDWTLWLLSITITEPRARPTRNTRGALIFKEDQSFFSYYQNKGVMTRPLERRRRSIADPLNHLSG